MGRSSPKGKDSLLALPNRMRKQILADKSAFKAKRLGTAKNKKNLSNQDFIDYQKKILHASSRSAL